MRKVATILIIFSTMHSNTEKIDINNCAIEELNTLPLQADKILRLKEYLEFEKIDYIYDLIYIEGISFDDIHKIRPLVRIMEDKGRGLSIIHSNSVTEESSISSIPKKLTVPRIRYNVNDITYDQLHSIINVNPIDVAAVLKQQAKGKIRGTFELKNSPGISRYGYKNVLSSVSFIDPYGTIQSPKINNIQFQAMATTIPASISTDEEEEEIIYAGRESLGSFYSFYAKSDNYHFGHLRYNNSGDPNGIYTNKVYLNINNLKFSNNDNAFQLDHIILGNFNATYGQGLVFSSGDNNRSRFTGYKWNKRQLGISSDLSISEQLTLSGLGLQASNRNLRLSLFFSEDKRDAIINNDGSFTSLIFMRPRLGFGIDNNNQQFIYENMIDAVTERTLGGNLRISINEGTNVGFTFYESLYDRVLDPQIINTITGGGGDLNPEFDIPECDDENSVFDTNGDGCICCPGDYYLNDFDEYSGDAFFNYYHTSNSADSELLAMYSSSTPSNHWSKAKSSRKVSGININTVIKNIALQLEYAKMYKNTEDMLDFGDGQPHALLINAFMQFDNLDILVIHRDYDLEFDNPYQKSFFEYKRYKSTIIEDSWWLEDPIFTNLYGLTTQPQAEKGTYIESRYQFHQNFILGLQWDNWTRKADNAKYYRMVTKLEWRPLFNYRIYFRYKLQARGSFSIGHPSPYFIKEARTRFKLRLSNYNHLELLYAWNSATFTPRPRLIESSDPFIISMNVGDTGYPDESIGFSFEHNFYNNTSLNTRLNAGAVYSHGFLWYFDINDFTIFDEEFGLVNVWFSFGINPHESISLSMKVSHIWDVLNTRITGGSTSYGNSIDDVYVLDEGINYRLQINYNFSD